MKELYLTWKDSRNNSKTLLLNPCPEVEDFLRAAGNSHIASAARSVANATTDFLAVRGDIHALKTVLDKAARVDTSGRALIELAEAIHEQIAAEDD